MTTKEKKLAKKECWNKDDLEYWVSEHLGEYLLKRIEVRKKMRTPGCEELTKKALAEISKKKFTDKHGVSDEWILERFSAMTSIIPAKTISITDDEELEVALSLEPKAKELIAKISRLSGGEE